MHYQKRRSLLSLGLAAIGLLVHSTNALAQSITLDGTLGTNAPIPIDSNPNFATIYDIQQNLGRTVGSNLFHSFARFNLTATEAASFGSDAGIRNIISRVTGGTASSIDGLIYTESRNVNLFLINPAGIMFGPNAQLNVGSSTRGSFVATTLDAMTFPGGGQFSAVNPGNASSLLTLVGDPSGFLASQRPPGEIASTSEILSVYPGQSLVLLGGEIGLNNSLLVAQNGRIELAGLAEAGTVGLTTTGNILTLDVPAQIGRSDVFLSNDVVLFVQNQGAGSIAIAARNLDVADSLIFAGIAVGRTAGGDRPGAITLDATDQTTIRQGSTLSNTVFGGVGDGGDTQIQTGSLEVTEGSLLSNFHQGIGKGGNLLINARGSVTIDGRGEPTSITTFANGGQGDTGDLRITANSLSLLNGGGLETDIARLGNGGQILLNIQDATVLSGAASEVLTSGISSSVSFNGVGRGGNIGLTTGSLSVANGAGIAANVYGQGDGGDVAVTARDTVRLDGAITTSLGIFSSNISSSVRSGIGNGGTIRLATRDLTVTNGAQIDASTFGRGNTGNISIDASESIAVDGEATEQFTDATGRLFPLGSGIGAIVGIEGVGNGGIVQLQTRNLALTNGGVISTVSLGQGNAAEINVLAHDSISVSGTARDGDRSGILSTVNQGERLSGGLYQGIGRGGDIRLVTGDLFLDQGVILASAISQLGTTGDIAIEANTIRLDNNSSIETTSAIGNGGNITFNVRDFVLLRRNSRISATAGTAEAGGDGGNIAIVSSNGFVVGVKAENSDITANAFTGSGGRVNITARGIYGLQFRPQLTEFSDITASSAFGINGTVTLNTPDVDPSRSLAQLPGTLIDPTQLIDRRCVPQGAQRASSFVITGRGGLPPNPFESLESESELVEWVTVEAEGGRQEAGGSDEGRRMKDEEITSPTSPIPHSPLPTPHSPLIEAQGLIQQPDGSIYLVAQAQTSEPRSFWLGLPECSLLLKRE